MRYAVLGGDMRFAHLVDLLNESGRWTAGFLQEKAGKAVRPLEDLKKFSCFISNWPLRAPLSDVQVDAAEILENIPAGSVLLLCGPGFPRERRWDLQYINLWEDEELLQENAWLTAEGAVASAMRRGRLRLEGVDCMVVGYGRIGRALTHILLNLGARVHVLSEKETKRREAVESGARAAATREIARALPGMKLVFSTPPAIVMKRDVLEQADRDAMLIDLASPPYGIDLEAAHELGLLAFREPGLPGRHNPMGAARSIYNAVLRWEEEEV